MNLASKTPTRRHWEGLKIYKESHLTAERLQNFTRESSREQAPPFRSRCTDDQFSGFNNNNKSNRQTEFNRAAAKTGGKMKGSFPLPNCFLSKIIVDTVLRPNGV